MKRRSAAGVLALSIAALADGNVARLGTPVSMLSLDQSLPLSTHPQLASDLGLVTEGRVGFATGSKEFLGSFAITVPGVQVSSSEDQDFHMDSLQATYQTGLSRMASDSNWQGRYTRSFDRRSFALASGISLGQLLGGRPGWGDAALGVSYRADLLYDADSGQGLLRSVRYAEVSATVLISHFSVATSWAPDQFLGRIGYRIPSDFQAGLGVYRNLDPAGGFGFQLGVEKQYYSALRLSAAYRAQYRNSKDQVEAFYLLGTSLRFRPWQPGVDPEWLRSLISPPHLNQTLLNVFYDTEIGVVVAVDQKWGGSRTALTVTRWF